jgi:hypothetical protein
VQIKQGRLSYTLVGQQIKKGKHELIVDMGSDIFKAIIEEKIKRFINSFSDTSEKIFFTSDGKLIHSGEFGIYREKVTIELIRAFIPSNLGISDGFIISSDNQVSTQCDIIVYDPVKTPLIEVNHNKFFPIESIKGVVEIKSNLDKATFREALLKLSKIKEMRKCELKKEGGDNSNVFTALICKSFTFNLGNIEELMNLNIYSDTKSVHKHNMILSIENGALGYHLESCYETFKEMGFNYSTQHLKETFFYSPVNLMVNLNNSFISNRRENYHILSFLSYLKNIGKIRTTETDLSIYLGFLLLEDT